MSPVPGFTVSTPSATVHFASPSLADFHLERSLPSKRTMASEGAVAGAALTEEFPGVTTRGTGFQSSDDSGVCFDGFGCAIAIVVTAMAIPAIRTRLYITLLDLYVRNKDIRCQFTNKNPSLNLKGSYGKAGLVKSK